MYKDKGKEGACAWALFFSWASVVLVGIFAVLSVFNAVDFGLFFNSYIVGLFIAEIFISIYLVSVYRGINKLSPVFVAIVLLFGNLISAFCLLYCITKREETA